MKTEETLVIVGIVALGIYILSKHSAVTAATTTTTPAAAPAPGGIAGSGVTVAQATSEANTLFGFLAGSNNNSSSTNSTNGTSPAGSVSTSPTVDNGNSSLDLLNSYGF